MCPAVVRQRRLPVLHGRIRIQADPEQTLGHQVGVIMAIYEAGQQHLPLQIHDGRGLAFEGAGALIPAHVDDPTILHRNGLCPATRGIDRVDLRVLDQQIGLLVSWSRSRTSHRCANAGTTQQADSNVAESGSHLLSPISGYGYLASSPLS